MQPTSISDIEKEYNLELDKIVKQIKKQKPKRVLLQFPDGMKPYSTTIATEIEKQTNTEILIYFGTCFGACDVPTDMDKYVDLVVQFGHSAWKF